MIVLPGIAGDQFWGRPVSSRAGARALESPLEEGAESFGRLEERRVCGASREVWEGCRRFWKGSSGEVGAPQVGGQASEVGGFQVT